MTIYALIDTPMETPSWTLLSGASILQGGNPYFVPDFAGNFEAYPSLAIRIGKLGKGFASRFAERYAESVAPCAIFIATDLLATLRHSGLPWTPAICYDRSLALGKFVKKDFDRLGDTTIRLSLESGPTALNAEWHTSSESVANSICAIARDNTLKTGDIIVMPWSDNGIVTHPDMKATLTLDDELSVKFNIR